jgi:hypothetical protein
MLHAIWKGPPAAPPQLWLLPRPALHSCAAGPHQRHLSPEHIVPELRGRQPALLAADMAMHMELWGPLLPAPLSYDLVPQQACVEAMHLRGVDAGTNRQPQVASDVIVSEGVAARAGGRRARAAGPRQVLHCQLAGLERRRLKQRGLHLWMGGVCQREPRAGCCTHTMCWPAPSEPLRGPAARPHARRCWLLCGSTTG